MEIVASPTPVDTLPGTQELDDSCDEPESGVIAVEDEEGRRLGYLDADDHRLPDEDDASWPG